jgi:hypothetical protein
MKCWNVTEDIDLAYRSIMDKDMSTDSVANLLLGIKTIYDLRFDELFAQFENMIEEGKIL